MCCADAGPKSEVVSAVVPDHSPLPSLHLPTWHTSHLGQEQDDIHGKTRLQFQFHNSSPGNNTAVWHAVTMLTYGFIIPGRAPGGKMFGLSKQREVKERKLLGFLPCFSMPLVMQEQCGQVFLDAHQTGK
jgi:hypothetical protein